MLSHLIDEAPTKGAAVVGEWARALASRHGIRVTPRREAAPPDLTTGLERLTPREHEVLSLVAQGLSNPEIGRKLYMSPKTASVHVSSILVSLARATAPRRRRCMQRLWLTRIRSEWSVSASVRAILDGGTTRMELLGWRCRSGSGQRGAKRLPEPTVMDDPRRPRHP